MENYEKLAAVTECEYTPELLERLMKCARLDHHATGLCTEVGEFQDALKKHIFYGKPLDRVNLKEELGDLCWYIAGLCNELGTTFSEVQEKNIAKLKARYGDKFSENSALNRDLDVEREILEG